MKALMRPRTWGQWFWPLLIVLFLPRTAPAYNFLYTHPDTGEPIAWEAGTTIEYWVDPGPLGRLSNEQALTLVQEAMKIWENASPLADVPQFEFAGFLPEDVDGTNFEKYVSLFPCYTDTLDECDSEAQKNLQTVVIFDDDRSILGTELCRIGGCGASAGARVFEGSRQDPGNILQAIYVIGPTWGSPDSQITASVGVMAHEVGHVLGLAHSSVNQQDELDSNFGAVRPHLRPTMYWRSNWPDPFRDTNYVTLHPDDIAGIATLYPNTNFDSNTVEISGMVFRSNGTPLKHTNVILRNIDDPLCEAYSFLSGRFCIHSRNTNRCLNEDGQYILSGMPAGAYTLEVEEIVSSAQAASMAPGLFEAFLTGDAEFWNNDDRANEDRLASSLLTVLAGETITGLDIVLSASEVADDRIPFIDLAIFESGDEARCPLTPSIDYAALIGIDESPQSSQAPSAAGGCSLIR